MELFGLPVSGPAARQRSVGLLAVALLLLGLALLIGPAVAAAASGDGWNVQYSGRVNDVSFPDAAHGWAVGPQGKILATSDGGITWTTQTAPTTMDFFGVSFFNASNGWVVGQGSNIFHTTNGGATWNVVTTNTRAPVNGVNFSDENNGWLRVPGGVSFTTDGGATWSLPRDLGMDFVDMNHGWSVGSRYDTATATTHIVIRATSDGGLTWTPQGDDREGSLNAVDFVDDLHGWATGKVDGMGLILATSDGGVTWKEQAPGTDYGGGQVWFADALHGWIATGGYGGLDGNLSTDLYSTAYRNLLATNDGGLTWRHQPWREWNGAWDQVNIKDMAFADASHVWALTDLSILATANGGEPTAPVVTGFTPTLGLPGTTVTLTGAFILPANKVSFNGVPATYRQFTATQITATVPPGTTSGPVTVTTPGGTGTSALSFTVIQTPAINSFSPTSGRAGTVVTLTGRGFNGTTEVRFGGLPATAFAVTGDTEIKATAPLKVGTARISVTAPGGYTASSTAFKVKPKITRLSRLAGRRGSIVTITGTDFAPRRGMSYVKFGTVKCSTYISWSSTRIRCKVPAKVAFGRTSLRVTAAGGTSNTKTFTVKR